MKPNDVKRRNMEYPYYEGGLHIPRINAPIAHTLSGT